MIKILFAAAAYLWLWSGIVRAAEPLVKAAGCWCLGTAYLWLFNQAAPLTGLRLAVNPVTAMLAGLGVPGLVLLQLLT